MEKTKKILFVTYSFAGGGAERVLVDLLKALDRKKFKPEVVTVNTENIFHGEIPDDVPLISFDRKHTLDPRVCFSMTRLIKKKKPDLVVSFFSIAGYLPVIACALQEKKIPVILTVHSNLTHSFKFSVKRFTSRCVYKILFRFFHKSADRTIAVSDGVVEDMYSNHGVPKDKCTVIYNPVDIGRIVQKAREVVEHPWLRGDVPLITACGRLVKAKNYPLLLKAMKLLLGNFKARLLVLGEGEDRASLEALAIDLRINEHVSFLGFKKNPHKYIAGSEIFVLSSFYEGFGNVIIEAMACGTPVVSTRCPSGPDEIITDGVDGLLVPVDDEELLAGAMLKLLSDSSLRRRLAKSGFERARDFSLDKVCKKYETIFTSVLR